MCFVIVRQYYLSTSSFLKKPIMIQAVQKGLFLTACQHVCGNILAFAESANRFYGGCIEEKRQSARRVAVTIEITFQSAGASASSSVLNLSNGGVFIKAYNPLPIDSLLCMQFYVPGDQEILDVQGRVVWIKQRSGVCPAGMGIRFMDIPRKHQEKIQAFVNTHLRS
jgi:uncharacterized protein (TIGR02266 family)